MVAFDDPRYSGILPVERNIQEVISPSELGGNVANSSPSSLGFWHISVILYNNLDSL